MKDFVNSIFNNDSPLGRFTAWFWLVFGANVMFVLFSLPVVTAGPAFTAMYHVMLKSLREDSGPASETALNSPCSSGSQPFWQERFFCWRSVSAWRREEPWIISNMLFMGCWRSC